MTLLTVKQTFPLLGYKREAPLYDDVSKGVFPPGVVIRLRRRIRFNREELEKFLAKGGTASAKSQSAIASGN